VLLGSGLGVVVEMIDDDGSAIGGQLNVELEEKSGDGGRSGMFCCKAEKNVSFAVDEVEENLWCERRAVCFA
jgi:hypothetical protein